MDPNQVYSILALAFNSLYWIPSKVAGRVCIYTSTAFQFFVLDSGKEYEITPRRKYTISFQFFVLDSVRNQVVGLEEIISCFQFFVLDSKQVVEEFAGEREEQSFNSLYWIHG